LVFLKKKRVQIYRIRAREREKRPSGNQRKEAAYICARSQQQRGETKEKGIKLKGSDHTSGAKLAIKQQAGPR
jgi:hypothetical protein